MSASNLTPPFTLTLTLSRWEREQPSSARILPMRLLPPQTPATTVCGLRFSLSQRERAGVREEHELCKRRPLTLSFWGHHSRTTIIRQRLRRAFLQRLPDGVAHHLFLPAQSSIPVAQHLDAALLQPTVALRVRSSLFRVAMLRAVQFDVQFCFGAEEIQSVRAERLLAAKLIGGETAVAQPAPEELLGLGVGVAQLAGEGGLLGRLFEHELACRIRWRSPSPLPSPAGRGNPFRRRSANRRAPCFDPAPGLLSQRERVRVRVNRLLRRAGSKVEMCSAPDTARGHRSAMTLPTAECGLKTS